MNKRPGVIAVLVAAVAAAAGLFASPSKSAAYCRPICTVALTAAGPSPSAVNMPATGEVSFENTDSVTHTVVFANGRCSLTLSPNNQFGSCNPNFTYFVGSYAYTVDGKFHGTVVTKPLHRSVTLTARTHGIRRGTRLTLHGRVSWNRRNPLVGGKWPFQVIVLARHDGRHPFEPIATVPVRHPQVIGFTTIRYGWKLNVQPGVTTTYSAKVTWQPPQGQIWTNAKSRPFTVRIRK
jgi:plastocyanin